jgi:hypothetical protein
MTPKEYANELLQKISSNTPSSIPYRSFVAAIIGNELGLTTLDSMNWESFERSYECWYDSDYDLLDAKTLSAFDWGVKRK